MLMIMAYVHTGYAPLVGPIVISCKQRVDGSEHREVFWEVKEDGVVGGTTDGVKASHFYLDDKGKGQFCIHYYNETSIVQHRECNSRCVYVRRSQLPNAAQIRVAVSDGEYDKVQDLLFKVTTRFRDSGPCCVNDWQGNDDVVYLAVLKNRFLWWNKQFYIQMDCTNDGTTLQKFTFSFVDAIATNHNSSMLFFCSKPSTAQPPTPSAPPTSGSSGSHAVAPQPNIALATPTGATTNTYAAVSPLIAGGTGLPTSSGASGIADSIAEKSVERTEATDNPPVDKPRRAQLLDGGPVDSDEESD